MSGAVKAQVTTARLPVETRNKLFILSRLKKRPKTDIIIEALEMYYKQEEENGIDSYTLGLPYFGKYGSGESDLSTTYKQRLKEKIRAKHEAQSRRWYVK
ncbi:MAG: ribbon-helix-helix domain-containing protein [Treponema sp.]|nr:ribbon-helix-helix domain-containing protein [Treponema sp.]